MRKVACWAVDDDACYGMATVLAARMFAYHHPDWERRVYLVKDNAATAQALTREGCHLMWVRELLMPYVVGAFLQIPTAIARCHMLKEVPDDCTVMVYFDSDGFVLENIDGLVQEVISSRGGIALTPENDPRFMCNLLALAFGSRPPAHLLPNQQGWLDKPMLNTGMLVAHGSRARRIGELALACLETCRDSLTLGEQGPIGAAVYELGIDYRPLRPHEHCLVYEEYIAHGKVPYAGSVYLDGKAVLFRHFCANSKQLFWDYLPRLRQQWGLC